MNAVSFLNREISLFLENEIRSALLNISSSFSYKKPDVPNNMFTKQFKMFKVKVKNCRVFVCILSKMLIKGFEYFLISDYNAPLHQNVP